MEKIHPFQMKRWSLADIDIKDYPGTNFEILNNTNGEDIGSCRPEQTVSRRPFKTE